MILKFAIHPTAWSVRFADKVVPLTVIWNVSPKVSVPTQLAFDTADGHVHPVWTFFLDASEHADGERRGPAPTSRCYLKTRLAETSPDLPSTLR